MLFRSCGDCCAGGAGANFLQVSMVKARYGDSEVSTLKSIDLEQHQEAIQPRLSWKPEQYHGPRRYSTVSSDLSSGLLCFLRLTIVALAESWMSCIESAFFFTGHGTPGPDAGFTILTDLWHLSILYTLARSLVPTVSFPRVSIRPLTAYTFSSRGSDQLSTNQKPHTFDPQSPLPVMTIHWTIWTQRIGVVPDGFRSLMGYVHLTPTTTLLLSLAVCTIPVSPCTFAVIHHLISEGSVTDLPRHDTETLCALRASFQRAWFSDIQSIMGDEYRHQIFFQGRCC